MKTATRTAIRHTQLAIPGPPLAEFRFASQGHCCYRFGCYQGVVYQDTFLIWVKEGTYTLSSQINVDAVVAIYGGLYGAETSLSERDWENNVTTISSNNSVRCLNITRYCEIDGFTIRNGSASSGAGIYIDSVLVSRPLGWYLSPRINNCTIRNNVAPTAHGLAQFGRRAKLEPKVRHFYAERRRYQHAGHLRACPAVAGRRRVVFVPSGRHNLQNTSHSHSALTPLPAQPRPITFDLWTYPDCFRGIISPVHASKETLGKPHYYPHLQFFAFRASSAKIFLQFPFALDASAHYNQGGLYSTQEYHL